MTKEAINVETTTALLSVRTGVGMEQVVSGLLKRVLSFNDLVVLRISEDGKTMRMAWRYAELERKMTETYVQIVHQGKCSVVDGVVDVAIGSRYPVAYTTDDLLRRERMPSYISYLVDNRMKRIMVFPVFAEGRAQGAVLFYSQRGDSFGEEDLERLDSIGEALSVAVQQLFFCEDKKGREHEKSVLLTLSEELSLLRNKHELVRMLNDRLRKLFYFSDVLLIVSDHMRAGYFCYQSDGASRGRSHPEQRRISMAEYSLQDPVMVQLASSRGPQVLDLAYWQERPGTPEWVKMYYENGIREGLLFPLMAGGRRIGAFALLSDKRGIAGGEFIKFLQSISAQAASALANILSGEEIQAREKETAALLAISNRIAKVRRKADLTPIFQEEIKHFLPVSHCLAGVISEDGKWCSAFMLDPDSPCTGYPGYREIVSMPIHVEDGIIDRALSMEKPLVLDMTELMRRPQLARYLKMNYECGMRELVISALDDGIRRTGVFIVFAPARHRVNHNHLSLIKGISSQLSVAIANIMANDQIERQLEEISQFRQKLEVENLYLQEEIQNSYNYGEIVGVGAAMRKVFQSVSQVGPTQSTVLITGETGTGKELVARAIHTMSKRKDKLMVKVNCAALPANLIESELFGHERGSFTGALDRRIGKFELANNSTLFLDEVGELPLDLQAKLLRALQEKEIERVGGKSPIKLDVRIIAATNRDLGREIVAGNFRSDLYYRLNVFPVNISPLRQRREDIPVLVSHFLLKHAKKSARGPMSFSSKVMKELMAYGWPGNVRELEHLVERSILLTKGTTITTAHLPTNGREELKHLLPDHHVKTINEVEREHIISVLKMCNGKVAGVGGAAEKLKIPSTTLTSKIRRLQIKKGYQSE